MPFRIPKRKQDVSIPLDSFSDIAFLLIIFFILTTSILKLTGIQTELPAGEKTEVKQAEKTPTVNVAAGRILFNDQTVSLEELAFELKAMKLGEREDADRVVLLDAAPDADYQLFFEVMALAGWPGWDETRLAPWMARIPPGSWFMAVHVASDQIVATAMGLHDHSDDHPFGGELGWVASNPAHQGQGLGLAVCAAVTRRLLEMGYPNVHLYTEHYRLAAIKTYLKLGYLPFLYLPEMAERWRVICDQLAWPYEPARWRQR